MSLLKHQQEDLDRIEKVLTVLLNIPIGRISEYELTHNDIKEAMEALRQIASGYRDCVPILWADPWSLAIRMPDSVDIEIGDEEVQEYADILLNDRLWDKYCGPALDEAARIFYRGLKDAEDKADL